MAGPAEKTPGAGPAWSAPIPMVGAATLARGRSYSRAGRVLGAQWLSDGVTLTGKVLGTDPAPYEVTVRVVRAGSGAVLRFDGRCSCPVGHNCKHAVAMWLSACRDLGPASRPDRPPGAPVPSRADPAPVPPRWAARFADLVGPDPEEADGRRGGRPRIGLQLELVAAKPVPRRRGAPGGPGIRMRPVLPSSAGNWVRAGVSWSRLDYLGYGKPDADSEEVALLRELRALAAVAVGRAWSVYGDEQVWLESIPSRRVWDLLRQAVEAGVALVPAARKSAPVVLEREPVRAFVDLSAQGQATDVTAVVESAAGVVAAGRRIFTGNPMHGVVWWDHDDPAVAALHLAPFERAPVPALAGMLRGGPVQVPSADVEEFRRQVLPVLVRRVPVRSTDGSVEVPEPTFDAVVCTVAHRPGPELEVSWWLESSPGAMRPVSDRPDERARRTLDELQGAPGLHTPVRLTGMAAARFAVEVLPQLGRTAGVEVRHDGEPVDYREVLDPPVVRLAGEPAGEADWFDLSVEVSVGGEPVPYGELFTALAEGASHLLLPSGAYFSLDQKELCELADLITEARTLGDAPAGRVRLSRFHVSMWDDLAALGVLSAQAAEWADAVRALAGGDQVDRPVPAGLTATLRPYQEQGFRWLATRFEHRLGGILADDMGLGKTVQALAVICHAREEGLAEDPFLVVAPTSVVGNWRAEAERFAPGVPVVAVDETSRRAGRSLAERTAGAGLVVTSYALFRLDFAEYEQMRWAGLLLDEAQFAKNPASHNYSRARRLPAPWKLAMTGTPLENSLAELWALTSITAPGLFARPDHFAETYRVPIERHRDQARLDQLRRRLRPVLLRRTKEEVADDLPAKQEQVLELDLDPRHRRLYDKYLHRERQKVLGLLEDMKGNRFEILRSLTLLRQAALDVSLVDPKHTGVASTKLDALTEMLEEVVADGHRVLVFSQFTRFLSAARRRAEDAGLACCYLDGRTRRREAEIGRFRAGEAPVFLISLKAGGFGLNLTEADYCILLDPWWNPATEAQAVDRAHRIGQTRNVMVYRLVARDTIEEKVMALKERKRALFDSVVGAGGFESAGLSAGDVEMLLG